MDNGCCLKRKLALATVCKTLEWLTSYREELLDIDYADDKHDFQSAQEKIYDTIDFENHHEDVQLHDIDDEAICHSIEDASDDDEIAEINEHSSTNCD